MSKIGTQVISDMEDHPELYDGNDEPDYNPANFVPIPLQELNQLIKELGDSLPF